MSLSPKVVTTIDSVMTSALGGIILTYYPLYYNRSSNYIIEPYSLNYSGLINRLGI